MSTVFLQSISPVTILLNRLDCSEVTTHVDESSMLLKNAKFAPLKRYAHYILVDFCFTFVAPIVISQYISYRYFVENNAIRHQCEV